MRLGASDCHRENLVANGEHPVLIDAEVMLSPAGWHAVSALADRAVLAAPRNGQMRGTMKRLLVNTAA